MRESNLELMRAVAATIEMIEANIKAVEEEQKRLFDLGIYTTQDGRVVQPSYSDRDVGGGYIVWPTWYARETNTSRRQYIKAGMVVDLLAKINRTNQYADLVIEKSKIEARMTRVRALLVEITKRKGYAWGQEPPDDN